MTRDAMYVVIAVDYRRHGSRDHHPDVVKATRDIERGRQRRISPLRALQHSVCATHEEIA
jgi:hypothetical protein